MNDPDVQNIFNLIGGTSQESSDPDVENILKLTSQSVSTPQAPKDGWEEFKEKAKKISQEQDYPLSVLLGQATLESARGTSNFAKNRKNYFGYMAYDANPNMARTYGTTEESIMDYINLIKNTPRYSKAYQQYLKDRNPIALLQAIKGAGYATDPNYVTKILSMPEFKENI